MLAGTTRHTDAGEQARFSSLSTEQQMLEIWLNTRETNGAVAELFDRMNKVEPKVNRHEKFVWVAMALFGLLVVGTPFLLWALDHVRWE